MDSGGDGGIGPNRQMNSIFIFMMRMSSVLHVHVF